MRSYLLLLLPTLLIGCKSVVEPLPAGEDTYTVSAELSGYFPSWSAVKQRVLQRANQYCASLGRQMVPGKWQTHGVLGSTPLNAELTFQCVPKGDELKSCPNCGGEVRKI